MLIGAVLIVLAVLGLKGWRISTLGQTLQQDLHTLEALSEPPIGQQRLATLGPVLIRLRDNAAALRAEAAPFVPLGRWLGWVPGYGPQLAQAGPLLESAAELASAANAAYTGFAPLILEQASGATIVARLQDGRPHFELARQALDRATGALSQIDVEQLPPPLAARLRQATTLLPSARDGVDLALAAPDLLGADGPRDYLLIAQNPDELRATGGFISAGGVLTLDQGRVAHFALEDSTRIDNLAASPYPLAPDPLRRYMDAEVMAPLLWVFRDANWSPDFPTAARQALDLYQRGKGQALTRAIAFDPTAVALLLRSLGPVAVEGIGEPVTADTVVTHIHDSWTDATQQGRPEQRKAFLQNLGAALLERLQRPAGLDMLALARALQQALDEGHILLFVPDSGAAAAVARHGWDGAVRPGAQDFLMVVSSNVGYNKVNPNIRQEIDYAVDLSDLAAPLGAVTIHHTNLQAGSTDCTQARAPGGRAITRYEDNTIGCYWNYLRVLALGTSALVGVDNQPVPDTWMLSGNGDSGRVYAERGEGDTSIYSTLVVVPLAGKRATTFRYGLPPTVLTRDAQGWRYRLVLQKQPGQAQHVAVQILLPPSAVLQASSIAPATTLDQILTFDLMLTTDQTLEITFQAPMNQ